MMFDSAVATKLAECCKKSKASCTAIAEVYRNGLSAYNEKDFLSAGDNTIGPRPYDASNQFPVTLELPAPPKTKLSKIKIILNYQSFSIIKTSKDKQFKKGLYFVYLHPVKSESKSLSKIGHSVYIYNFDFK